ncbi:MAG: flagellar type III secretion system pore protein FliP [Planctomycetota bacterium]
MTRRLIPLGLAIACLLTATVASAQADPAGDAARGVVDLGNPLSVLRAAGESMPGEAADGFRSAAPGESTEQGPVNRGLSATLSILFLLTVLSLAPAILIMCTCFTRIVVVLALLRQAIGTQSVPPSQVIIGLSLFLTLLVMAPTFEQVNREAITPLQMGAIDEVEAWERAKAPIRRFMFDQIQHAGNWDDVYMILRYRGVDTTDPSSLTEADVDMLTLVPAFILSELKVAFLLGFRLYLPFLVIDMVVSSVLISMGMLMLPPILISLPFKLLMFVLVDGWRLVVGSLLNGFAVPGATIPI